MRLVLVVALLAVTVDAAAAPRVEVKTSKKVVLRGEPFVVRWQLYDAEGLKPVGKPAVAFHGATAFDLEASFAMPARVVIPERAGPLEIPAVSVALERLSDGAAVQASSEPLTVFVLESTDSLLPATRVQLRCSAARSAEALLYTVEMEAFGDLRTATPRFRRPPPVAFDVAATTAYFKDDAIGGTRMVKTLTYTAKAAPSKALPIPRLELPFRDTASGLPAHADCDATVSMPAAEELAGSASRPEQPASTEKPGSGRWALPALLLASSIALFVIPRKRTAEAAPPPTIQDLRSGLVRMTWESGLKAENLEKDSTALGERYRALRQALAQGDAAAVDPEAQRLFDAFEAELRKKLR